MNENEKEIEVLISELTLLTDLSEIREFYQKHKKVFDSTEKYWKFAANNGEDSDAQYYLGFLYENQRKFVLAEKYLKLVADNDHSAAQYYLGDLYERQFKLELSVKYFKLVADKGHSEAQFRLGFCYLNYKQI